MALEEAHDLKPLIEVLDRVVDHGIIVDPAIRPSLVERDLAALDARVVVAAVETRLRTPDRHRRLFD